MSKYDCNKVFLNWINIKFWKENYFLDLDKIIVLNCGPGGSSGKALGYVLDGPGSIPVVGGVEMLLHSFVSRLVLGSTQPPIK